MLKIYGRPKCPYCTLAISFCDDKGLEYEYVNIKEYPEGRNIIHNAGMTTVPCIFDGNDLIGGYDDLVDTYDLF